VKVSKRCARATDVRFPRERVTASAKPQAAEEASAKPQAAGSVQPALIDEQKITIIVV
jgi:hypothetical protein